MSRDVIFLEDIFPYNSSANDVSGGYDHISTPSLLVTYDDDLFPQADCFSSVPIFGDQVLSPEVPPVDLQVLSLEVPPIDLIVPNSADLIHSADSTTIVYPTHNNSGSHTPLLRQSS